MIDYTPAREKEIPWPEFAAQFSKQDLIDEINHLTDTVLDLIADCTDAVVVFTPQDPDAHDPFAEKPEDEDLCWNLGHVIVHITASNEEAAFIGAELARGVQTEMRRSRYEIAWESITTIEQARHRLEESRRMVLGGLDMWPDEPHLDNHYQTKRGLTITPMVRTLFGFSHAESHLGQIEEIVRQAKAG
jgi:hypothetical protein